MQKTEQKQKLAADFMKILFLMYFLTLILLLLLALVLFKTEVPDLVSKVWLIAVYIISGIFGGFFIGKRTKSRKFLWGLFIGLFYFLILFVVSVILNRGLPQDMMHLVTTMILCAASAMVGGMVS